MELPTETWVRQLSNPFETPKAIQDLEQRGYQAKFVFPYEYQKSMLTLVMIVARKTFAVYDPNTINSGSSNPGGAAKFVSLDDRTNCVNSTSVSILPSE